MATLLDRELATFRKHREELLRRANGAFVLVKGDDLLGEFATLDAALDAGHQKFCGDAFLVKQVLDVEAPLRFAGPLLPPADATR